MSLLENPLYKRHRKVREALEWINSTTGNRHNVEIQTGRNKKQQPSRSYDYNYERQNNFRCRFQNLHDRIQEQS